MPVLRRPATGPARCLRAGFFFGIDPTRSGTICEQFGLQLRPLSADSFLPNDFVFALTDATSKSDSGVSGNAGLCCVEPAVFV